MTDVYESPSWLARIPTGADALYVAAAIERNLPREGWRKGIKAAQARGFAVDVDYLRDRWTLTRARA